MRRAVFYVFIVNVRQSQADLQPEQMTVTTSSQCGSFLWIRSVKEGLQGDGRTGQGADASKKPKN